MSDHQKTRHGRVRSELVAEPSGPGGNARGTGLLHLLPGDLVEWSIDNHRAVYAIRHR